jgi:hypothetical protein
MPSTFSAVPEVRQLYEEPNATLLGMLKFFYHHNKHFQSFCSTTEVGQRGKSKHSTLISSLGCLVGGDIHFCEYCDTDVGALICLLAEADGLPFNLQFLIKKL